MIIVNEFGKNIDITKVETEEQDLVRQYIHHDDIVFELG